MTIRRDIELRIFRPICVPSITTTQIYTHTAQDMLQAAIEQLPMAKLGEKDLFIKDAALSK